VQPVLEFFLLAEQGAHDRAAGERFIAGAQSFADWCEQQGQSAPAATLRQAVREYQTLLNSPLDVDAGLLSIVWDTLEPALSALAAEPTPAREAEANAGRGGESAKSRVLRVREDRLDEFLRHVSSLFITCELYKDLHQRMAVSDDRAGLLDEMRQINRDFSAQSADLQQHVLALTRVSAAGLFAKFPKVARGLAGQLGKQVEVIVEGEDTEFDKALIDDLDAALTHLVRNVMDHGLETPEQRQQAGKAAVGKLWLSAEQTRTHTLITIRDNGRGIDAGRVRRKAVEKGLLSQARVDALSDQEAVELVFHAGFSTAEQVSEVSGRGVGMDAVRATLAAHGGRVLVETLTGQGTTFRLEIPIRSAVLVVDGLMVEEHGVPFVLAFEHIREIIGILPQDLKSVRGECIAQVRGQPYHAARLGKLVGLPDSGEAPVAPTGIVVSCRAGAGCLLVERVRGHRQVVVSPLRQILPKARRVSGVARLGGGRLALVLDVEDLIRCLQS
jgi:two-component system chemotaxis sensor kinase CheA